MKRLALTTVLLFAAVTSAQTPEQAAAQQEGLRLMKLRPRTLPGDPIAVAAPTFTVEKVPKRFLAAPRRPPVVQFLLSGPKDAPPLRVFIQAGLKTHAEGQHDYPQFLADWSKLLTNRGAIVDGALHFPTARELSAADVLIIYKGDAGYLSQEDRATLDNFLRRGGGIVSFHDALCGPNPEEFAGFVGGAKKHGEVNYTLEADVPYTVVDTAHPITKGVTNFSLKDEAFFSMTWSKQPEIHVLATAVMAKTPSAGTHAGEVVPQIWTYEKSLLPGAPA